MEVQEEPKIKIDCKQGFIRAVRFNANGQYAMTCGSDRTIKLWRPSKLLQLKCYKGHSADVIDCQANRDSSQFVSCSNDKSVISWDVESGKILRRFRNFAPFNTVCYGGEASSMVLAGSQDGTVKIYDLRVVNSWDPVQTLTDASDSVTCCRVLEHLIFSTSLDKALRTYDLRMGKLTVDTMHLPLNYISIGQSGECMLVSCLRSHSILIDRNEAKILNEYEGNDNKLFKLENTFVLDNSCIATGSEDGKVYLWDLMEKKPRMALNHPSIPTQIIQSISSDTLDSLLTACAGFMFMWSL